MIKEKLYIERYKSKTQYDSIVSLVLLFVAPLYSVPFIIKGMWKQKRWAFIQWALFMGFLGILLVPTGDFYRYTMDYELYKGMSWDDFWLFASVKNEFMLPLISYILGYFDLNFDLSRFVYNAWGYYLLGSIYLDIVTNNLNFKKNNNAFYSLGFFITFSLYSFCYRYSLSAIFFVYGAYNLVYNEKKSGWIWVLMAIFNHFSFVVQGLFLLLQRLHFFYFSRKLIVCLVILSFSLDGNYIVNIFQSLPFDFVSHYMVYLDGNWAGDFLEDHSWKYRFNLWVSNAISYFCIIVFILQYKSIDKKYSSLANAMLVLVFLSVPFVSINVRFIAVMMYFIKISFLKIFDGSKKMVKYLKIMFWLTMISNIMGLWSYRRQFIVSDFPMLLYSSSINILSHTYDSNWIEHNVATDGDLLQINF